MKTSELSIILSIILIIAISGCSIDAERDNPLDPKGVNYNPIASLSGTIMRLNSNEPIPGVSLYLSPGSFAAYTDEDGYYYLAGGLSGDFTLLITHPEYKDIETQVSLSSGSNTTADFKLDALPVFDSVSVTSQRILVDDLEEDYDYFVHIHVSLRDPDGSSDIDSGRVECSYLDQVLEIENGSGSEYDTVLTENQFPDGEINNMLGIHFELIFIDKTDDTLTAPPQEIQMVFDFSLDPVAPDQRYGTGSLQTGNPIFQWDIPDYNVLLEHFYTLKVFRDNGQLSYEKLISEGCENYTIDDSVFFVEKYELLDDTLSIGDYNWTLQLEDSFGNFTRSAATEFVIQQSELP